MELKIDHKIELKEKLFNFYNSNKLKINSIVVILIIILISLTFLQLNNKKKNKLISEKYIQAGLYLASEDKVKSKNLYQEIIFSSNKFYSILALNKILEKNLESDNNKILKYFEEVEKINLSREQKDLIIFKKSLFLIKISNQAQGKVLLKSLIQHNSKLKSLAEEVIAK